MALDSDGVSTYVRFAKFQVGSNAACCCCDCQAPYVCFAKFQVQPCDLRAPALPRSVQTVSCQSLSPAALMPNLHLLCPSSW